MNVASILLIDDNRLNIELARFLLEGEGFQVWTAESAPAALDLLQTIRPQLILVDIQLPGMDGLTLTRQLKADPRFAGTPIVALTAYAMKEDEDRARAAGCDGYLTKPIDTRTFTDSVRHFLPASDGAGA